MRVMLDIFLFNDTSTAEHYIRSWKIHHHFENCFYIHVHIYMDNVCTQRYVHTNLNCWMCRIKATFPLEATLWYCKLYMQGWVWGSTSLGTGGLKTGMCFFVILCWLKLTISSNIKLSKYFWRKEELS